MEEGERVADTTSLPEADTSGEAEGVPRAALKVRVCDAVAAALKSADDEGNGNVVMRAVSVAREEGVSLSNAVGDEQGLGDFDN